VNDDTLALALFDLALENTSGDDSGDDSELGACSDTFFSVFTAAGGVREMEEAGIGNRNCALMSYSPRLAVAVVVDVAAAIASSQLYSVPRSSTPFVRPPDAITRVPRVSNKREAIGVE
jgi:hypothetical protein